jgi:ribosomal protein S4
MKYPGYLLNPGDMFSVDPDMVMFATGNKKGSSQGEGVVSETNPESEAVDAKPAEDDTIFDEAWEDEEEDVIETEDGAEEEESETDNKAKVETEPGEDEDLDSVAPATLKARSKELKALRDEVVDVAKNTKNLKSKRKQELRALYKTIRAQNFQKITLQALNNYKSEFQAIKDLIANPTTGFSKPVSDSPAAETAESEPEDPLLQEQLREVRKNPHLAALKAWPNKADMTKPYHTPWQPREFMSAFAFIPRYLEVNQNVCSAVYLRDPVAKPGVAEVPSPFNPESNLLAFQWYLRRR